MKKLSSRLLIFLLTGGCLFSCSGGRQEQEKQQPTPQKGTEPSTLTLSGTKNYSAEPQDFTLSITCDVSWDVTLADASWAKLVSKKSTGENSGEAVISLSMNRTRDVRKQTVTLKAGSKTLGFEIEQAGLSSILDKESVIINGTASTPLLVKLKSAWTLSVTEGADWLSVSPAEGDGSNPVMVQITPADGNVNVGDRSGAVELAVGGETLRIPVLQGQTDAIVVAVSQYALDGREQDQIVPTKTNVSYSVRIPSESSWISHVTAPDTKALNKQDVVLHLDSNTTGKVRTGTVFFEKDTVSRAVVLRQAPYSSLLETTTPGVYDPNGETFTYRPGTDQIAIGIRNGSRYYKLIDPELLQVFCMSGLPVQDPQLCDSFEIILRRETALEGPVFNNTTPVTVIGISDHRLWLITEQGGVIILNK